ncbi:MAG: type II toxin-antitoxin system VapC family toxin [Candidatus Aminicenantes bacterium]|nr:type II toxin-antitoxin system VapC family toxin [Candidatus Aminicenantes bacterium]
MILYLETSNLVKLYVRESDSEEIAQLIAEAEVVATSIVAYPEARAAFARKFREKGIVEEDYLRIKKDLDNDWDKFFIIRLTDSLAKSSGDLVEKCGLRGFDALHLASALELKKALPHRVHFSSSDARLKEAALNEGLL